MKTQVIKLVLTAATLIFGIFLIMIIFGACSSLFGATDAFYCGAFCLLGKVLLSLSLIPIGILTFRAFASN